MSVLTVLIKVYFSMGVFWRPVGGGSKIQKLVNLMQIYLGGKKRKGL